MRRLLLLSLLLMGLTSCISASKTVTYPDGTVEVVKYDSFIKGMDSFSFAQDGDDVVVDARNSNTANLQLLQTFMNAMVPK